MKRLLRVVCVLAALLVVGSFAGLACLDEIAAGALRRGGSKALGVETTVGAVDLSLGSTVVAELSGLVVSNPPGFESQRFLSLGSGALEFPFESVFDEVIRVPELALGEIELNLERRGGQTNYDVILQSLEDLGEGEADERSGGRRFLLERIVLTEIDATIDLLPLGGDLTRVSLQLKAIVIEDLRGDMSTAQIFGVVIRALLTAILEEGADLLPADLLRDLGGQLDGLGRAAFDITGGALESSTTLISRGGELLKTGAERLGAQAEEVLQGLGGLLKKKNN